MRTLKHYLSELELECPLPEPAERVGALSSNHEFFQALATIVQQREYPSGVRDKTANAFSLVLEYSDGKGATVGEVIWVRTIDASWGMFNPTFKIGVW